MSAIEPEPSDDLTPEQRRQRIIALLARAVMCRVRWLRRTPTTDNHAASGLPDPHDDLLLVSREILV